jgi:molybdate transport system ATP-binding protein
MIEIHIEKELKFYDGIKNLKIDLEIEKPCFLGITGSSGSGKTSFLRMVSGLTTPDSGKIEVCGNTWYSGKKKINLHPSKRPIGYVPQEYTLFPHMTVRKNIEYAAVSSRLVDELLDMVEMRNFHDSYPRGLSGGQKQRVALARALAREPEMVLMDEPFAAVDCRLKGKLSNSIKRIHERFNVPVFLVSHNREILDGLAELHMEIESRKNGNYGRIERVGELTLPEEDSALPLSLIPLFSGS